MHGVAAPECRGRSAVKGFLTNFDLSDRLNAAKNTNQIENNATNMGINVHRNKEEIF